MFKYVLLIVAVSLSYGCATKEVLFKNNFLQEIKPESGQVASSSDEKPGRFFTDQPDVTDDYQIHFNYLLAKDSIDRELDINGDMEEILLVFNKAMLRATAEHKDGNGVPKKYKFDFRKDGKLDITFIRLKKNFKDLKQDANNDIVPFLFHKHSMKNLKKIYYNFADIDSRDGGEAGVGVGSTFLRNKSNWSKERVLFNVLHELHHTQGGGYSCVPGMGDHGHYRNQERRVQLTSGTTLGQTYAHSVEGCPQLQDSVYLTPTSKEPYDPYQLNCMFDLGGYTHEKLTSVIKKQRELGKYNWRIRFGSSCKWRNGRRDRRGYFMLGSNKNLLRD
jgi:hypothetical protein